MAMHMNTLGWRESARHILDTHLLMYMEWCPCRGTNSCSNHKPNAVWHVDSDVHKVYLRQQAGLRAIKKEDADDGQEELAEDTSKGTKRKLLK
ncbi:hypothetical protein ACEPAI_6630 [Sanghuangporus weigelae]